jgi:hypothetical protein
MSTQPSNIELSSLSDDELMVLHLALVSYFESDDCAREFHNNDRGHFHYLPAPDGEVRVTNWAKPFSEENNRLFRVGHAVHAEIAQRQGLGSKLLSSQHVFPFATWTQFVNHNAQLYKSRFQR